MNPRLPDPTPFVYRQYIKGRGRVRTNAGPTWHEITLVEVPGPSTYGVTVPINPTTYLEDGKLNAKGLVLRYGYREAAPYSSGKETDMYFGPSTTPPQKGYHYQMSDEPGPTAEFFLLGSTVNGISVELSFRGDVVEVRNGVIVRVWARKYWSFSKHYKLTSRTPLLFEQISEPA